MLMGKDLLSSCIPTCKHWITIHWTDADQQQCRDASLQDAIITVEINLLQDGSDFDQERGIVTTVGDYSQA